MTPPRPLSGIRVVDFTWVRAGPWATRWLAVLGAEVIKIEWPQNLDMMRRSQTTTPAGVAPGPDSAGHFADMNVNKLGITLNVRTALGSDMVRGLIAVSDVVIENFSSRVMQGWGLGYDAMRAVKPDIIYVSMAGFGHTGRWHSYMTMGPSAQALSGMTFQAGLPGRPPAGWGWSYLDDTGGMYGAMYTLAALRHRDVTGRGQHVDLSQMTTGVTLTGAAFLDRTVNGRPSRREGYPPGNRAASPGSPSVESYRGPIGAPHNSYRTRGGGYNDWCVIACFGDDEWRALAGLMGSPPWATDPALDNLDGRIRRQEEMDREIESWTSTVDKYELAARCQAAGVRAMPVQSSQDRVENDPQLRARRMYTEVVHPVLGRHKVQNAPFKLSSSRADVRMPAPLLGEHTPQVMQGLLGLGREALLAGYDDGTFWPAGVPRRPHVEEALT